MRTIAYTALKLSCEEGIATITLNRPEDSNRLNGAMADELRELCAELAAGDGVRGVILTGEGAAFSVGRTPTSGPEQIREMQAARFVAALPAPVLVALNGDAADHGLELSLAGDLRLAAPAATFGFTPPSAGSFPFDGGTQRLPRLIGPAWARDMLFTGRRVDAREALSIGLVNRLAGEGEDVLLLARRLAGQIAEGSPLGARYVKEAVALGADMTLGQGLTLEADMSVILQSTADRAEGIASFLERRQPEFTGE